MSDNESGGGGDPGENGGPQGKKYALAESQAGIMEMGTMIANDNITRTESSSDLFQLSIHQVARDGDFKTMERLLASLTGNVKKKVNLQDDEDLSALHYAARYNHYSICKLLVEKGADVNDKDEEGATPLHYAARYKRMRLTPQDKGEDEDDHDDDGAIHFSPYTDFVASHLIQGNIGALQGEAPEVSTVENSVIIYLVHKGADVNKEDNYGCRPLHFAAMRGNEVATKELLSCKGINIEAVDKQQMTALHLAASHNEVEVVRMLIDKGANLRCVDEDMGTPLHFACMDGSLEVASLLFEAGEKQDGWVTQSQMVTDQDNQQNTPLHLAVENRSLSVAKLCLDKGADVNSMRNNYQSPLHLAAIAGELDIVKLLVDNSARIDALDINQETPLHKAAAYDHADIVEYLIQKGAHINKHDKDNFSPLLIAACNGHAETIKTLLRRGANLFDVDKNDKTAIFWAAEEDNLEALKVLLEHRRAKTMVDISDRYDNTPLHIAAQKGYLNCIRALLDANADMDAKNEEERIPLHLAAMNGKTNAVREFVKKNRAIINHEDEDSNTALHHASLSGHNKVVQVLIEAGADIEARNCSLWTPLDCAAAKGWHKTVKLLLEADAPVDPMDKTKTTPLHLASARGHVQCVTILLNWWADVTLRDSEGLNCLDLAIDNGHKDVAMAIVNCDRWKEALRNETIDLTKGRRTTPMRKLIVKLPDVAERVFNRCMETNGKHPDADDYKITFNYEFLDDMYCNWADGGSSDAMSSTGSIYDEDNNLLPDAKPYSSDSAVLKNNHPLMIMVKTDQEDLLAHPLVTSLLRHKWNSYGRYVYYLNLVGYCIFLTFLTCYVCLTRAPYSYMKYKGEYYSNLTSCDAIKDFYANNGQPIEQHIVSIIGKYIIWGLAGIYILRELFQFYNAKLSYLGWENLIEWVTYITAIILVVDFSQCQQDTGIREHWQWNLAAVSTFLAWMDLVLFIRKLPRFGIYVVMFTDVLKTFFNFFPVFFLFIVAFAMAYFCLIQNQLSFDSVGISLLKTSVMMIGEFEFTGIFLGTEEMDPNTVQFHDHTLYFKPVTYAIFVVFIIMMSIIIMNLLVGLAVDDIKAVQELAELKRLAMQVELALDVEGVLPQFIRRKFVIKCKKITPNIATTNPLKKLMHLESNLLSSAAITKALNPELEEIERVEENQEKMMADIARLKTRMKAMTLHNNKMEAMMKALFRHHNVQYEEEDVQEDDSVVLAS